MTYQGMMGTTQLGRFSVNNSGLGDTKVVGLVQVFKEANRDLHVNIGLSLPTGSIDERAEVLTPMNTRTLLVSPYSMQLGSGSYDLEAGLTYNDRLENLSWGSQIKVVQRLNDNDRDYRLGNEYGVTGWGAYRFEAATSLSTRLESKATEAIEGRDARINAPIQSADPANYGGDIVHFGFGINFVGRTGAMAGHRLLAEYSVPVYQNVHGVQMKTQEMLMVGYQYAF